VRESPPTGYHTPRSDRGTRSPSPDCTDLSSSQATAAFKSPRAALPPPSIANEFCLCASACSQHGDTRTAQGRCLGNHEKGSALSPSGATLLPPTTTYPPPCSGVKNILSPSSANASATIEQRGGKGTAHKIRGQNNGRPVHASRRPKSRRQGPRSSHDHRKTECHQQGAPPCLSPAKNSTSGKIRRTAAPTLRSQPSRIPTVT